MVTVIELLSHPVFKGFSLVTDRSGIYNRVRDTGIFEWENEEMLKNTFHEGSFILTTLAVYKDDPDKAFEMVELLISRRPSAICIKRIYFKELPRELIDKANKLHVPIMFFSDTYFPDIIFTVRNALTPNEINSSQLRIIKKILFGQFNDFETELLAKDINPLFQGTYICAYGNVRDHDNASSVIEKHESLYRQSVKSLNVDHGVVWSRIYTPSGILILYCDNRLEADHAAGVRKIIKMVDDDFDDFAIGISDVHDSLSEIGTMIKESIYAAVYSQISGQSIMSFENIGLSQMLCPLCNNPWATRYCDRMIKRIRDYDEKHNSDLFKTMYEYVKNNGDANKTAENLFQHVNTIRYRLRKIYSVLGTGDSNDKICQLYILVTLYEIRELLNMIMKL